MPILRPTPHMGSVNTPITPMTRATSTQYQYPPYAGMMTNAAHGVCQHAGYSYDTCDLNTINIPHMPARRPTPHMGSVNMPVTPTTRASSTQYQYPPYTGTTTNAAYGVCQHVGYSYDICNLNTISISPICRYDDQRRMWGLSTRRLLLQHVRPHKHRVVLTQCNQYPGRYIG
ncbi:unnamed protein product [Prunus armeniaca]